MDKRDKETGVEETQDQLEQTAEEMADTQDQPAENQDPKETEAASEPKEVEQLKAEKEALQDKYLRLLAEFENFKKRNTRERIELLNTAARDTLTALLPALDDFDRALSLPEEQRKTQAFQDGILLVYQKLKSTLQQRGLETMDTEGAAFDPELHEALTEIPAPSEDMKGKIIDTIEKGYTLKGKIIRHAKVVVGK